jgi:hypothetical protein
MEHMQHTHDGGFMQGGMHHVVAKGVSLDARLDVATRTIILREGPMSLPANTSHMKMPQPPDVYWTIDFDGWLLSYSPKLVEANGQSVPGTVLHHTAFWNTNRADFLCPNKEEHIFGRGRRTNQLDASPRLRLPRPKGRQNPHRDRWSTIPLPPPTSACISKSAFPIRTPRKRPAFP